MSIIMEKEIKKLEKLVSNISVKVEENLNEVIKALIDSNVSSAKSIKEKDNEIDLLEIEVEEECLKILALHQPVAIDLRYIIAVLKINNDLERIGDLTTNIARVVIVLSKENKVRVPDTIPQMTEIVLKMLKKSLDSLFSKNLKLASKVQSYDDEVDQLNADMYKMVQNAINDGSGSISQLFPLLSVSRYLERIADHATNIAEDVEYYVKGKITRHHQ